MSRMRKPSAQTMRILEALIARAPDWVHGYDLAQLLDLNSGTLYPILARLADRGQLESRWTPQPTGPARHEYLITSAGAKLYAAHAADQPTAAGNVTMRPGLA